MVGMMEGEPGAESGVGLGGDFLFEAEVFFDGADALKRVVDFFLEAGDVLDLFAEIVEVAADRFEFRADGGQLVASDGANVVLCRLVFVDTVRERRRRNGFG
jgi:hypothetical protein